MEDSNNSLTFIIFEILTVFFKIYLLTFDDRDNYRDREMYDTSTRNDQTYISLL